MPELDADCLSLDWVLRFLEADAAAAGASSSTQFELDVGEMENFLAISRRCASVSLISPS